MAVSFKNENSFNFLSHLIISFVFTDDPPPLKSVTMATRNALFPIFKFQKFTNTYLGKVTKFQFNCFSRLGAAFKKPEGAWHPPPPSPIRVYAIQARGVFRDPQRFLSITLRAFEIIL